MKPEMEIMHCILDVQKERDEYRAELKKILAIPYRRRSKENHQRVDRLTSCIISCNDSIDFNKKQLAQYR